MTVQWYTTRVGGLDQLSPAYGVVWLRVASSPTRRATFERLQAALGRATHAAATVPPRNRGTFLGVLRIVLSTVQLAPPDVRLLLAPHIDAAERVLGGAT